MVIHKEDIFFVSCIFRSRDFHVALPNIGLALSIALMYENMVSLNNFVCYGWSAYLMYLQWFMRNVMLGVIMSDFVLSLAFPPI